jgi:four helix bundle protein
MENKKFSKRLEERTKAFAIQVIRLSACLPNDVEGRIIRNQLTKSGTSIGANYREANRARSRADFKNKAKISESEATETCYWLEIIRDLTWVDTKILGPVIDEADELLAIFASIGKSLNTGSYEL